MSNIEELIKKEISDKLQELIPVLVEEYVYKLLAHIKQQVPEDQYADHDLLTEKEAAKIIRKAPKTLRNYRYSVKGRKDIPFRIESGKILYKYSDLIAYLEKNTKLSAFNPHQKESSV